MEFNINEYVKVKLTERGIRIMRERHDELAAVFPGIVEFDEPKVDDDGFTKFQLWGLIETFGASIYIGCDVPFDTTIEIPLKDAR